MQIEKNVKKRIDPATSSVLRDLIKVPNKEKIYKSFVISKTLLFLAERRRIQLGMSFGKYIRWLIAMDVAKNHFKKKSIQLQLSIEGVSRDVYRLYREYTNLMSYGNNIKTQYKLAEWRRRNTAKLEKLKEQILELADKISYLDDREMEKKVTDSFEKVMEMLG